MSMAMDSSAKQAADSAEVSMALNHIVTHPTLFFDLEKFLISLNLLLQYVHILTHILRNVLAVFIFSWSCTLSLQVYTSLFSSIFFFLLCQCKGNATSKNKLEPSLVIKPDNATVCCIKEHLCMLHNIKINQLEIESLGIRTVFGNVEPHHFRMFTHTQTQR
jgi:hypothetical protein